LNKKIIPKLVVVVLLAVTIALAWMYWPAYKDPVEVSYDQNWKMGSDNMEVIKAYHEPCLFCYSAGGVAPSINFEFDGTKYTTSHTETGRFFVKPVEVPKNVLFFYENEKGFKTTYQSFFVAMKPWGLTPNSYIAAVYAVLDGKDVYYSVDEVYNPGWAYELSLKPLNSEKSIAEHSLKPLSMMMYVSGFLLGVFILSISGFCITEKLIKNR